MATLTGKYGAIYLPTGTGTLSSGTNNREAVAFISGYGTTSNRNIEIESIWTAASGGTEVTDYYYTTDGFIKRTTATTGTLYVRYYYWTDDDDMSEVGSFFEWNLEAKVDVHNITDFASTGGAKEFMSGLTSWKVTAKKYWIDSESIDEYLESGSEFDNIPFVARFYVDDNSTERNTQYEGLCFISGLKVDQKIDGLVTADVTFQGTAKGKSRLAYTTESILTDGAMASDDTYWTAADDFSLDGGASYEDSANSGTLTQAYGDYGITAKASKVYRLQYDYGHTADKDPVTLTVTSGFASTAWDISQNTTGTYVKYILAKSSAATEDFVISATSGAADTFTLDNIYLQEVTII